MTLKQIQLVARPRMIHTTTVSLGVFMPENVLTIILTVGTYRPYTDEECSPVEEEESLHE